MARLWPEVTLLVPGRNLGAPGRNLGVRHARTPYVAFSDDDSWWEAGSLARAADLLDRHTRLGLIAACVHVGPDADPDLLNGPIAPARRTCRGRREYSERWNVPRPALSSWGGGQPVLEVDHVVEPAAGGRDHPEQNGSTAPRRPDPRRRMNRILRCPARERVGWRGRPRQPRISNRRCALRALLATIPSEAATVRTR
ncbi:glycosyltransferase [Streptomyces sp. NPDC051822]|uniref:glycosyltransferase n=1 Tax=Streptomyces sp. NPDC051822 TaxID=3365675 RepID=UPI00379E359B